MATVTSPQQQAHDPDCKVCQDLGELLASAPAVEPALTVMLGAGVLKPRDALKAIADRVDTWLQEVEESAQVARACLRQAVNGEAVSGDELRSMVGVPAIRDAVAMIVEALQLETDREGVLMADAKLCSLRAWAFKGDMRDAVESDTRDIMQALLSGGRDRVREVCERLRGLSHG